MKKNMSPSTTEGQIAKLQEIFAAALRKEMLPRDAVQLTLELQGRVLAKELISTVHKRVQIASGIFMIKIKIDRTKSLRELIGGFHHYDAVYKEDVIKNAPGGVLTEADLYFFQLGSVASDDVDKKYDELSMVKPDPYLLAWFNKENPSFSKEHPNILTWQDSSGSWCDIRFRHTENGPTVFISHNSSRGNAGGWWYAGIRK